MERMSESFTVTREDLYRAACTQGNGPCAAHRQTVDQMIERLERRGEEE